ncbi:hypothetical protein SD71_15340 [Cohnella kolymensis]|uniref:N-acetyltransferase domain-containing protein n=1 Tax=Cohnella kolymensis TaxID=1590652 RepID=A0ABR5A1U5_9BACL|nr:GNAT family protein [Cohnella kolymensis]KIL35036.1 hypothetical protein SD71_15340 [Cohnella kolymensis]
MNSIILTGERVTLRNITTEDLHTLWAFIYGEEFPEWKNWDAPYFPLNFQTYEQLSEQMKTLLQAAYWNGGYGTEALRLWIDYLLSSLPLVRIGLTTWSGNPRMVRCAEKLGMKMEGCIRKCRLYKGNYYDSIRMGMLREEWTT